MKYLPLANAIIGHSGYQQHVKEGNIKQIFDLVRSEKCKSRAEIVRAMNLSATSVSVLVEELAARGLIDEVGPTKTSLPGRRPISLQLNGDARQMVVFALQREGVRYTLFNLNCQMLESRFFPLDIAALSSPDAEREYLKLFEDVLKRRGRRIDRTRTLMIGISFPGIYIERDQLFHTDMELGCTLTEASIRQFQEKIGLPVYLISSTRAMAYAEKKYLEAANADPIDVENMIFVEFQGDLRCSIISDGDIYAGPYNASGEIGHLSIDFHGPLCSCGNRGCLQNYVNLNAILKDARQAAAEAGIEPPESLEALAARYPAEPVLAASVERSAQYLAFGLYGILCTSGIRRIVLGGGIDVLGEGFLREVYHALCSRSFLVRHLELSYAQAGPDSESVGVAQHFLDKVYTITH